MTALIFTADGFEDSERLEPLERLRAAGVAVEIASIRAGPLVGTHGARVEDRAVVLDGNLITSRQPADRPAFVGAILQTLDRGPEDADEAGAAVP